MKKPSHRTAARELLLVEARFYGTVNARAHEGVAMRGE